MQPLALSYGYVTAVAYVTFCVLAMTPLGVLILSEAQWTAMLSPVLAVAYPYTVYKIWIDDAAPCDRSMVQMIRNREEYGWEEFI